MPTLCLIAMVKNNTLKSIAGRRKMKERRREVLRRDRESLRKMNFSCYLVDERKCVSRVTYLVDCLMISMVGESFQLEDEDRWETLQSDPLQNSGIGYCLGRD